MKKRGQFYLITALIIIILIMGLIVVFNYSKRPKTPNIYELGEELKIESGKVLDYGAVTGSYPWDEFTKNFTDYAGKEIKITYIVGSLGGIGGSYEAFYYENNLKKGATSYLNDPILTVTHNNLNYSFAFKKGENFYFVMSQSVEGEYHVITN